MSVSPYHRIQNREDGKQKEEAPPSEGKRNGYELQGRLKKDEQKSGSERTQPLLSDHVNPLAPRQNAPERTLKGRGHRLVQPHPVIPQGDTPRPGQQNISLIPAGPQPNRVRVGGGHTSAPVNPNGAQQRPAQPSRIPVGQPNQRRAN